MKKSILIILLLAITAGAVTGCGGKDLPGETAAPGSGKTVITMVAPFNLPEFEAGLETAHPEIDLQVEYITTGMINGETARRLRNGHGSDLLITNLPAGEAADYAYDLSAQPVSEKYQASIIKSIMRDGLLKFLPLPGAYYGYFVNKTLLDEFGLELPETNEDLLNILAAAQEHNTGVFPGTGYGFGLSDVGATFLGAYITGDYATDFLSGAEGAKWKTAFEKKEAGFTGYWENCINFLKSCIDHGYMDPDKMIILYNGHLDSNANAFKAEEQIPERTAVLSFGNLEMFEKIRNKTDDEIVMLPCLPYTADGNKLLSAVSNNYIAVNKALEADEAKLAAALDVLEYLSTEDGQKKWIQDTVCLHSYLNDFPVDVSALPESVRKYAEEGMIYANPFPTNLLSYMGKMLTTAAKGKMEITDALKSVDDYYLNGSEAVEYDFSVVGTVARDMLYENFNTRKKETELGNFISDAIREATAADVALVNGGGIRSSLYKGDVTGDDLSNVCPYGNLIIVVEMNGATLREAIRNGIQKTWKPAGQFLQVSGIRYSFKPAADETETAELLTLSYTDGTEVQDGDVITVAYTNYMGGSSGYADAGDGYTMLNVYDSSVPVTVKLLQETNKTYCDALRAYFSNHKDQELSAELEGRIEVIS